MKILILNGPNLREVGKREVDIYGSTSLDDFVKSLQSKYPQISLMHKQSNHEGQLLDWIWEWSKEENLGIVLNAGSLAHTSIALADAIKGSKQRVIEVHISNVWARESFRHHSYLSPNVIGVISGLGILGYDLAIMALVAPTLTT